MNTHTAICYVGLGSNLDNPEIQVQQALGELNQLPKTQCTAQSSLYRSRAVGPGRQAKYINAVAQLATQLSPLALLDELQSLEHAHQRKRLVHWGPRTLDLDILLYDYLILQSDRLVIPHPYLTQRNFVLYPLAEIAPELHLPNLGSLSRRLSKSCKKGLERLAKHS